MKLEMMTQTEVLARQGWTKELLVKLLGEPDLRKSVYGRKNLAALYLSSRVTTAESSGEFESLQASVAARKLSAAKAVSTKTENLLDQVEAMKVDVTLVPLDDLQQRVIENYNDWNTKGDRCASHDSDAEFLDRISVNFIRHNLTKYDQNLEDVAGKTGIDCAVSNIRSKIYEAIGESYPSFEDECNRQLLAREIW